MIHEARIDAERNVTFVDEKLCGVNHMTYHEWIHYQDHMLKYYSGYLGDELYEYDESDEEEDEPDKEDEWGVSYPKRSRAGANGISNGDEEDEDEDEDDSSVG